MTAPQNTDPEAGRIQSLDQRFAEVKTEQDRQRGMLEQVLGKLGGAGHQAHAAAQQHEQDKLNRPTDVADEVRRQFAERDQAAAADQAQTADKDWRAGVDQSLAELREKPPEAPVRRVERLLGWRH